MVSQSAGSDKNKWNLSKTVFNARTNGDTFGEKSLCVIEIVAF